MLASLLIAGLWVDGWAHFHDQVDDSFFTPWHFLFYSGFGLVAIFVAVNHWRNVMKGHHFRRALPQGYWFALMGVIIFAMGGVGDMIWHTLFGIEQGSEALTSPSHLLLVVGMLLIVASPVRAAWARYQQGQVHGWRELGPALIGSTLFLSLLAFFSSYAHPLINPTAANFELTGGGEIRQTQQVYVMNADGSMQTRLTTDGNLDFTGAVWSPDGSQIAYAQGVMGSHESDLYVMNGDGTEARQLTSSAGSEFSPTWSPDGTQIAFVGMTEGSGDIYVLPSAGGEATRLTETPGNEESLAWSPDGTQIAYVVLGEDTSDIYVMNADGSGVTALTNNQRSYLPSWSPDGSQIVYTSNQQGGFDIFLMNADGSDNRQLTDFHSFDGFASFSPDGQQILFVSWRGPNRELYTIPVSGEISGELEPVSLTNNPALIVSRSSYSPDGSKIMFTAQGQASQQSSNSGGQDLGLTSVLLQAGIIGSIAILLTWRWQLPFGALTLVLTLNSFMMAILSDLFLFVPSAIITGLIADILIWRLKPAVSSSQRFHVIAFIIPALYFALYFLTIQLVFNIGWSIHVWSGAIVLAGFIGLLVSYLITASQRTITATAA